MRRRFLSDSSSQKLKTYSDTSVSNQRSGSMATRSTRRVVVRAEIVSVVVSLHVLSPPDVLKQCQLKLARRKDHIFF